jgi:glucokinase
MSNVAAAPVLLADIGGTHSRFALLGPDGRPAEVVSWDNDGYANLEAAIETYLGQIQKNPQAAVLAVAGPVAGRDIALTNRSWRFNLDTLAKRFGLSQINAINDFEAQAWALAQLREGDYRVIGRAGAAGHGVKVVLGPGTGLGVAALVPVGDGWQAVPTEGGHVSFGAAHPDEEPIFARMRKDGPISAESVISGSGMPRLHRAVNPGAAALDAAEIVAKAKAGEAAAAVTIRLFVRLFGRFAGDVALTFKATGGVYVAGGVTAKLGALFDEKTFREAFEAHPPYEDLLRALPTYLVTVAHPGLIGCGALALALQKSAR